MRCWLTKVEMTSVTSWGQVYAGLDAVSTNVSPLYKSVK